MRGEYELFHDFVLDRFERLQAGLVMVLDPEDQKAIGLFDRVGDVASRLGEDDVLDLFPENAAFVRRQLAIITGSLGIRVVTGQVAKVFVLAAPCNQVLDLLFRGGDPGCVLAFRGDEDLTKKNLLFADEIGLVLFVDTSSCSASAMVIRPPTSWRITSLVMKLSFNCWRKSSKDMLTCSRSHSWNLSWIGDFAVEPGSAPGVSLTSLSTVMLRSLAFWMTGADRSGHVAIRCRFLSSLLELWPGQFLAAELRAPARRFCDSVPLGDDLAVDLGNDLLILTSDVRPRSPWADTMIMRAMRNIVLYLLSLLSLAGRTGRTV